MNAEEKIRDEIDDYRDTIYAIVGFVNLYRFDDETRSLKEGVTAFQGRKLEPSAEKRAKVKGEKVEYVVPDLGIVYEENKGVLGEVKKSFPSEPEFWLADFEQLMSYDDDLTGWPTEDEKLENHDLVLLVHQSRAVAVNEFYQENLGDSIFFERPFVIIRFNRSDERQPYFYFEKIGSGSLSESSLDGRLRYGIQVPMGKLVDLYSMVKLYDAEPPLAYVIFIIWEHVVNNRAMEDERYPKLRKNQKLEVVLRIEEIVGELHKGFSFASIFNSESERQPKTPKKEWVINACEKLVGLGEAAWETPGKSTIRFYFKKYEKILNHFVELCSRDLPHPGQKKLNELLGKITEE